jgi:hypothetical protein
VAALLQRCGGAAFLSLPRRGGLPLLSLHWRGGGDALGAARRQPGLDLGGGSDSWGPDRRRLDRRLQHDALGYPHSFTSISISKKEYSILVIEILYSIHISLAPVLSLSYTLYPLFHILFPSLPLSLSLTNSLSLSLQCLRVNSGPLEIALAQPAATSACTVQARGAAFTGARARYRAI